MRPTVRGRRSAVTVPSARRWPRGDAAPRCPGLSARASSTGAAGQPATPAGAPVNEAAYRVNNPGVASLEQVRLSGRGGEVRESPGAGPSIRSFRASTWPSRSSTCRHAAGAERGRGGGRGARAEHAARRRTSAASRARAENRVEDAIAAFERVLALDPEDVGARVNLGQSPAAAAPATPEAAALFQAALDTEPYNATAAYNLGVALTRSGQDRGEPADDGRASRRCARAATARPSRTPIWNRAATGRRWCPRARKRS